MSQTNLQFSVACHLLAALAYNHKEPLTSAKLALSVGADVTFVRRTIAKLARAELIRTTRGKAGACLLARRPSSINLLDVYQASQAPAVFAIHGYPIQPLCPTSCHIKDTMSRVLDKAQSDFEKSLSKFSLADLVKDIKASESRA
ncbi:Rrf2 family transcriptional regulator [Herbaspirillum huttiense]|uniref:Rrf2 family transcriptional regulator n=1 Tax=Herbaspirillum huttiense TaxID=863372 RepID=UPI0039AF433B